MANPSPDLPPVHLRDHLRVIRYHKWTAVSFFVAVVGLTALYLLFSTPTYSAKVVMVINPPAFSPLTLMSELVYSSGLDVVSKRLYVTTQFDVLKSRRIAERVLDRLNLWDEYHVGEERRSFLRSNPATVTREEAARALAESVSAVSPNIMSNSVELTVRARTPDLAARIANSIVEVYLETLYEDRERKIQDNLEWLRNEFKVLESEVLSSDEALQNFKKKHNTISVDDRENVLTQKLQGMNAGLVQARIARLAAENAYADARQLERDPTHLERASVILASNPQIAALQGQLNLARTEYARVRERYGEKHPRMIELSNTVQELEARIRQEVLDAVRTLQINYDMARTHEEALIRELEATKQEVLRLGEQRIHYLQLADQSMVNRTMFDNLLNRLKETKILLSFENPRETLHVIDPAIPPDGPAGFRPYFLPVAAGVGLLVGLFLCYVREYFDDTLRCERDVAEALKLPVLGTLPYRRMPAGQPTGISLREEPGFAEGADRLAGIVRHLTAKENLKVLLVAGACPGEGKTTVAAALGAALARAGHRVLLVDGDFRTPALHRVFQARNLNGFASLLQGTSAEQAVTDTGIENLACLPAGSGASRPSVLLGSESPGRVLRQLKDRFDYLLVDSTAVLAASETASLARWTDAVLWVTASGETPKEKAIQAQRTLNLMDSRILGVVLNKVPVSAAALS